MKDMKHSLPAIKKLAVKTDVCIMGSGHVGTQVLMALKDNRIRCTCFADNDTRKQGTVIEEVEIVSPDVLRNGRWIVIIAVQKGKDSIREQLEAFRNNGLEIVDFSEIWDVLRTKDQESQTINYEGINELLHPKFINEEIKRSRTYRYLSQYLRDDLFEMDDLIINDKVQINKTIWSLWMQGEEPAPKLVKKCFESIRNNVSSEYDYIVLDEKNIADYISLPNNIIEKYRDGIITKTHMSDLIRLELLSNYGGAWIDATVFCSDMIPPYMLNSEMFMFRSSIMEDPVHKMSSWWMQGRVGNRLFVGARNLLFSYWEKENTLIDYYLIHAVLTRLIDEDNECRRMFYQMPYFSNSNPHVLWSRLSWKYDPNEYGWIRDCSKIHKLSYKKEFYKGSAYTFYNALLDGLLG